MEFWITDDGTLEYCDADMGVDVPSHEMIVTQYCLGRCLQRLLDSTDSSMQYLGEALERYVSEGTTDAAFLTTVLQEAMDELRERGELDRYETSDVIDWLWDRLDQNIENDWYRGFLKKTWEVAWGRHPDPVYYAIHSLSWIRVAHREIMCRSAGSLALQHLAGGLYEAYGEEVINKTFNIEAGSFYLRDVPYAAIEENQIRVRRGPDLQYTGRS